MQLNAKQKLFCDLYKDTTNKEYYGIGSKCYQLVYNSKDLKVAEANSSRLLSNGKIKAYLEGKDKSIMQILAENSQMIIEKAINEAQLGNTTILNKLLDKIVPTLIDNSNTNYSPDELLNNLYNKHNKISANVSESEVPVKAESDDIPLSVDNQTS